MTKPEWQHYFRIATQNKHQNTTRTVLPPPKRLFSSNKDGINMEQEALPTWDEVLLAELTLCSKGRSRIRPMVLEGHPTEAVHLSSRPLDYFDLQELDYL